MKSTLIVLLFAAVALNFSSAASLRQRRQLVPREFSNINIDQYLKNRNSVLFQLKCIVYDGPCDRIGKYLKVTIPDVIQGTCSHCSAQDKQTAGRLVAHIQKNFPKEWHDAVRKFQGQAVNPAAAAAFGINIEPELLSSTAAPSVAAPVAPSVNTPVSSAAPAVAQPAVDPAAPEPAVPTDAAAQATA